MESLSKENESLKAQIDGTPSTEAEATTEETEATTNADDKGDGISAIVKYQDYTFSATNLLGYSKDLHDANSNSLSSKSGSVAFEIPDNVANSSDKLILSLESGSQSLNFKVR